MSKYIFTTLAIGVNYNYKVRTLIDCVLLLTKGDIMVITDDVADLTEYVKHSPELDASRLFLLDIKDVSTKNVWFAERMFNFNLKILPTSEAYRKGGYDTIIHCDADGFLISWDEDKFEQFMEDTSNIGMIARFRNRPCEETGIHWIIDNKARSLSIDINTIKARMPIEVFMYFHPSVPQFKEFMDIWHEIVDRCYNRGIDPFIEALEISYALSESRLAHHDILSYLQSNPALHSFRYLHHDKIMKII